MSRTVTQRTSIGASTAINGARNANKFCLEHVARDPNHRITVPAHIDKREMRGQMVSAGVTLIRLDWQDETGVGGFYHLDSVDELARAAEKDPVEATYALKRALKDKAAFCPGQRNDWPDLLLCDLSKHTCLEIGAWAEVNGLARETVCRGFATAYGTTPSVLRAELRARLAWLRITRTADYLCSIAVDTGFADQAHMTRWVRRITGATPAVWRRCTRFRSNCG